MPLVGELSAVEVDWETEGLIGKATFRRKIVGLIDKSTSVQHVDSVRHQLLRSKLGPPNAVPSTTTWTADCPDDSRFCTRISAQ